MPPSAYEPLPSIEEFPSPTSSLSGESSSAGLLRTPYPYEALNQSSSELLNSGVDDHLPTWECSDPEDLALSTTELRNVGTRFSSPQHMSFFGDVERDFEPHQMYGKADNDAASALTSGNRIHDAISGSGSESSDGSYVSEAYMGQASLSDPERQSRTLHTPPDNEVTSMHTTAGTDGLNSDNPLELLATVTSQEVSRLNATMSEKEPSTRKRMRSSSMDAEDSSIDDHRDPLTLETEHLSPPIRDFNPTPISPERCFCAIKAEKMTPEGRMYKVVWRESWVHEARLPDIKRIRELHSREYGRCWDVIPSQSGECKLGQG